MSVPRSSSQLLCGEIKGHGAAAGKGLFCARTGARFSACRGQHSSRTVGCCTASTTVSAPKLVLRRMGSFPLKREADLQVHHQILPETSVTAGCVTFTNRNLWRLIFVGLLMGWNGFPVNPVYLGPSELISVLTHLRFGLSLS